MHIRYLGGFYAGLQGRIQDPAKRRLLFNPFMTKAIII